MNDWWSEQEIEQRVLDLVGRARQHHALPEICEGATACAALGLGMRQATLPAGTDGMLIGNHIVVNETITWGPRVSFTVFHELIHYLLDEDGELIEYFTRVLRHDARAFDAAIERCCDIGAAEFLMPQARVRHLIATETFSVTMIERIAGWSGASLVAAALQTARCAPVDCYSVIVAHGPIPRAFPPRTGLYLEYAFPSPGVKYPLARFTPVPADHLLAMIWRDSGAKVERSYIPFRSGKRQPCYGEGQRRGSRVLGLLALHRPLTAMQLPLLPSTS